MSKRICNLSHSVEFMYYKWSQLFQLCEVVQAPRWTSVFFPQLICHHIFNTFQSVTALNFGWSTRERRAGLVQTPLWLPVAYCHFKSKLQPDVEQNGPEIKTAEEARRFKAKQDSWLTATWHVRWWNYDSLLQTLHSTSCCTYTDNNPSGWPSLTYDVSAADIYTWRLLCSTGSKAHLLPVC